MSAEPTGHKRGMRIVIATAVALLAGFSGVAEAKGFRGETSQKRMSSLITDKSGKVTRIRISYSAPCSDPRYRFPNVLRFEPPFKTESPDEVSETVTLRERLRGGGRSRQTATVTARRVVDAAGAESWSGTFKTRAVLTKGGKRLDVCELKRVTWTATPTS
ncbi:hypothetical protein [Solirubrobacter soli]|uniref:hypothetical protein n=1 Tax=Solirubrobacter soli TaxID=363832 RepID=UPI0004811911|nr:hypothetical protein [Solirubrobacter soli]